MIIKIKFPTAPPPTPLPLQGRTTKSREKAHNIRASGKPEILDEIIKLNDVERREWLKRAFRSKFGMEARDLQIETVMSLTAKRDAFLLASTGYGKTKIPELFSLLFSEGSLPVVLILNPLDALGDNQVTEKAAVNFKAINLTRLSLTNEVVEQIKAGVFQFIYVSPEIFVNSPRFESLFFSREFQSRLVLKVVDEAHLIYCWGLAISGQMKYLRCHRQSQDRAPFRPSYGDLASRFMSTETVPTLLMSATCPPKAIDQILASLKIPRDDIDFHLGEHVRPEIRIIRIHLKRAGNMWDYLKDLYPKQSEVPDLDLPPTLIYCKTQDATLLALRAVNQARGNPADSLNGVSSCIRRFHATTGAKEKVKRAEDFVNGQYTNLACTTALGMGQNWGCVRRVIIIGQVDPTEAVQMSGRAGRDGRPAIAIWLFEGSPGGGKTPVNNPINPYCQNDDERMHALAITTLCFRASLAVDLKCGYIPLLPSDPAYLAEIQRQKLAEMPMCLCSNCDSQAATKSLRQQKQASKYNFDDIVLGTSHLEPTSHQSANVEPDVENEVERPTLLESKQGEPFRCDMRFIRLFCSLRNAFRTLYAIEYPRGSYHRIDSLFSSHQAWMICKNHSIFLSGQSFDVIFGSEPLPKSYSSFTLTIEQWRKSRDYYAVLHPTEEELTEQKENKALAQKLAHEVAARKEDAKQRRNSTRKNQVLDEDKENIGSCEVQSRKEEVREGHKKARTN